jgi:hypothetical protein
MSETEERTITLPSMRFAISPVLKIAGYSNFVHVLGMLALHPHQYLFAFYFPRMKLRLE